jgi:hypothetical protein
MVETDGSFPRVHCSLCMEAADDLALLDRDHRQAAA